MGQTADAGEANRLFETYAIEHDGLAAEMVIQPAINYALVVNRVPIVRKVTLTNRTSLSAHDLSLELSIVGPQGALTAPWTVQPSAPVPPGRSVTWEDFAALAPDIGGLQVTDEAYPVDVRLVVTGPDREPVRLVAPARVLAHNEWCNHPALYDSLAAFVQPNTPAVEAILRAAAAILLRHTGSGALDGYQSGSARAALIAGAVYEALRGLGITYQSGLASFEQGQKIRTVSSLVQARLGNCLDLAVAYAACLEQAGLHPLIWLTDDHAVGGFFLEPERLGSITVTEVNLLASLVDIGRAVPVELTGVGVGPTSLDFAAAVRAGVEAVRGPDRSLRAAVDIALAHRSGIRPMPTLPAATTAPPATTTPPEAAAADETPASPATAAADETVVLTAAADGSVSAAAIELPPGAARERLAQRAAETAEARDESDPAPPRIRQWKRALLDLSLRNPLLNLPARGKGVDLYVPAGALKDLDDLIHAGKRITIVAQDAVSQVHQLAGTRRAQDLDPAILERELREERRVYAAVTTERYRTVCSGLQRAARTMQQETGSNYLYLTLGTLVHPKENGTEAHAPLFLLPVRIEGGLGRQPYRIVIDGTETASPNHCLVEWLRVKHRARLPELERPILDDAGIDIPRTLQALRDGLVAHQLNYRIDETASLRLLQFATFQMWRDLTDHWQSFMDNPVVRHLVAREETHFVDPAGEDAPSVDEASLHLPIEADGSQMRAVLAAERGRSFVLEGPPGTGKSQTITNMIARAIHTGRTVLFVAEKQAALEVVKRRLDRIGLGPFVLDLHGRKQSLTAIRAQLREALDQVDPGDDGAWEAATTQYRAQLAPLSRYPDLVHERNAAGLSLWQAVADGIRYGPGPTATIPITYLTASEQARESVARALAELPAIAHAARLRPGHPWALSSLRDVRDLSHATVLAVAARVEAARAALAARPALAAVVRELPGPAAVGRLIPVAALARDGALPDRPALQAAEHPTWDNTIAYVQASLAELWRDFGSDLATFRDDILTTPQLDAWSAQATEAADKILWWRSRGLARVAEALQPYVRGNQLVDPDAVPQILGRLVAVRLRAADIAYQVERIGGLALPPGWRPTRDGAAEQFARAVEATRVARALLRLSPQAWEYLSQSGTAADHDVLVAVNQAWRDWSGLLHVVEEDVDLWLRGGNWYDAWQRDGAGWLRELRETGLAGLQRWAALLACTDALLTGGLPEFRRQLLRGEIDPDDAEAAYRRGLAARSLAERVQAGDLEFFEAAPHNARIAQYDAAAAAVRTALLAHLPATLVRRREFDPAARRGPAVELAEQIKRKRGGHSFRELFATWPDLILALTPCVLVSPASAAHFIPPDGKKFDLVIFDEASQIRVAEAIGAMGRGRATVIVGDSKQMPPTAIMQASHEAEDEPEDDQAAEDMDSILSEAVESRVPQQWLSWHYRSRDESLIAFSNRRYYESKLYSLPSPTASAGGSTAIVWRRVNGEFDRGRSRTNRIEAQAVVDEIRGRLHDPATAHESIGVVTFNIQQRDLILDLLEASDDQLVHDAMAETLEEPIFVKNLENVQGDERDTILFSLAFSTDPNTGLLPLNFGPLSQAGGERRLNVAITRAKKQVLLFASFDPADIDLSRTNAQGTRDLRAYCEMAANGPAVLGDLAAARTRQVDEVRAEVAAAIRDRGHDVVVGHGLSEFTVDIAVRRPGSAQWQVAIILDGPAWARRSTVADRDGAPLHLRRHMGWPELVRFWLPAWLRDREAFLQEVDEAVQRATERELAAAAEAAKAEAEKAETEAADVETAEAETAVRSAEPVTDPAVRPPEPSNVAGPEPPAQPAPPEAEAAPTGEPEPAPAAAPKPRSRSGSTPRRRTAATPAKRTRRSKPSDPA